MKNIRYRAEEKETKIKAARLYPVMLSAAAAAAALLDLSNCLSSYTGVLIKRASIQLRVENHVCVLLVS